MSSFLAKGSDWQNLVTVEIGQVKNHGLIPVFLEYLKTELARYEITISGDYNFRVNSVSGRFSANRRAQYCLALQTIVDRISNHAGKAPDMILFILPGKDAAIYADIKWWADCVGGVPSICVTGDAIHKAVGKPPKANAKDAPLTKGGNYLDKKVYGNIA